MYKKEEDFDGSRLLKEILFSAVWSAGCLGPFNVRTPIPEKSHSAFPNVGLQAYTSSLSNWGIEVCCFFD